MTAQDVQRRLADTAGWTGNFLRDIGAGVTACLVGLPICLASGALAFSTLGATYASAGIAGGLYGAVFGGFVAALFAAPPSSSPPRVRALALFTLRSGLCCWPTGPLLAARKRS